MNNKESDINKTSMKTKATETNIVGIRFLGFLTP